MPAYPPELRNPLVQLQHWGHIRYQAAWDRQKALLKEIVDVKVANRTSDDHKPTPNYLVFNEHHPVFTLGKSGDLTNLLISEEELKRRDIDYYHIERGGDITYHGPGQLTGYLLWDLENFATDLHWFLRNLEEVFIQVCEAHGLVAGRVEGLTGVWIDPESPDPRKICAIGIKCSRWVTMHGFAFNLNTDLSFFESIVPCGITDKGVTSLARELGHEVDYAALSAQTAEALQRVFGFEWAPEAVHAQEGA